MNDLFQALASPVRREILRLLSEGDMKAGEIAERLPIASSTLSGHLNILKSAGLVVAERQATTITYSLSMSVLEEGLTGLMAMLKVSDAEKGDTDREDT